ncbi:MAG: hypothetical protein ACI4C1_08175 [Lachnospiraceae bacterium]
MINIYVSGNGDETFLMYVAFCICNFIVSGHFLTDETCNRLGSILVRSSYWQYVCTEVIIVALGNGLCMLLGDLLCLLLGCSIFGLPLIEQFALVGERTAFMENGHPILYLIFWELRFCCQAAFWGEITLIFSIFIKNTQYLIIFPMIARYFFWSFLIPSSQLLQTFPLIQFFSPKSVYWFTISFLAGNDIAIGLYALAFTFITQLIAAIILNKYLRRNSK